MNKTPILEIKDLQATINENEILKNLNLKVHSGEIHAIMGPNGSGKSTFSKVLAGHPAYEVLNGQIVFKGINILELDPEERSHLGRPMCRHRWSMTALPPRLPLNLCRKAMLTISAPA